MFVINIKSEHPKPPSLAIIEFVRGEEIWRLRGPYSGYKNEIGYLEIPIRGEIKQVLEGEVLADCFTRYSALDIKHIRVIWEYLMKYCDFGEYILEEEQDEEE